MNIIDIIVRDVAELPDRTSPDGQPDLMSVTDSELRDILQERLGELLEALRPFAAMLRDDGSIDAVIPYEAIERAKQLTLTYGKG